MYHTITHFRRGQILAISGGRGTIKELGPTDTPHGPVIQFELADVRFVVRRPGHYVIYFGNHKKPSDYVESAVLRREPKVGDVVMYDVVFSGGSLRAVYWTYEDHFLSILPNCTVGPKCGKRAKPNERYCDFHMCLKQDDYDDEQDVTTAEVRDRARRHLGDGELADEAASMYPGDYI